MNNKEVSIILFTWFLKHILNGIYVHYFQVFPFKPIMVLLVLHLIHIKCLKYNISDLIMSTKMVINFIFTH